MSTEFSSNSKAILLLTAPLIAGRGKASVNPLTTGEYHRLARRLRELRREPADLLGLDAESLVEECRNDVDSGRLERLLGREFLLGQAVERWRSRAIWVVSQADAGYPRRLKKRLGEDAPPVLYGCGDAALPNAGGLAVVGSRNVKVTLIGYAREIGRLAAAARRAVISGGARGIDQAAMRGALEAGGNVVGILADSLERVVVRREHRDALNDGRLTLLSPYDPAARFSVGHALRRNKLIYALADAALVVDSDYGRGGTWGGATEQLERLKSVPVHVRADGNVGKGLDELRKRGAKPWPNPKTGEELEAILDAPCGDGDGAPRERTLSSGTHGKSGPLEGDRRAKASASRKSSEPRLPAPSTPGDVLFAKVVELLDRLEGPRTDACVAEELRVSKYQAGAWLRRFVDGKLRRRFEEAGMPWTVAELADDLGFSVSPVRGGLKRLVGGGVVEKVPLSRPVRYRLTGSIGPLFDRPALRSGRPASAAESQPPSRGRAVVAAPRTSR